MNIVFTQILTSFGSALKKLHEKNWRESLPVLEFHHPPNFPCILAAIPESQNRQNTTGHPVLSWSLFYWFWELLAWSSSGLPELSSTSSDTGTGEMSLSGASSRSRTGISPIVGEEGEDEEDDEE